MPETETTAIESPVLTLKQTCDYMNVTEAWLRRAVYKRDIPYIKMRRQLRFRRADLDAWMDANYHPAASDPVEWE